jgi:hypothetical protein
MHSMPHLFIFAAFCVPLTLASAADKTLADFRDLVTTATWEETWPGATGEPEVQGVTAELWTQAIQAFFEVQDTLRIPGREQPYYLDGPIVLKSGQTLIADSGTEIRLRPGTNTCMVRNENLVGFPDGPVPVGTQPDHDITVEGGIWTTLATSAKESNGNLRGASAEAKPVPGTHGVILLQNVRAVTVRNLTVRQSRAFAIHLANVEDFTVDGLTLENHRRDGVHVNGPARRGLIRRVGGESHDDTVALNAWEWKNYGPSYGAIYDIVIEDISGAPEGVPSANSIRFLPGKKRFSDGALLDCPIHDITVRRITDITEFKLYDQPNLEVGRDKDFSAGLGMLKNLRFEDLTFSRPGRFEIHAELDGLVLHQVTLAKRAPLILIGPKSQTYRSGDDPARWVEIFSPDLDCMARNLSVSGVRVQGESTGMSPDEVIRVIVQTPNPDYPATTPRGGTGKGVWRR